MGDPARSSPLMGDERPRSAKGSRSATADVIPLGSWRVICHDARFGRTDKDGAHMKPVDVVEPVSEPTTPKDMRKICAAGAVGTGIELYDFLIFGLAAGLVFPKLFFPGSDPLTGASCPSWLWVRVSCRDPSAERFSATSAIACHARRCWSSRWSPRGCAPWVSARCDVRLDRHTRTDSAGHTPCAAGLLHGR